MCALLVHNSQPFAFEILGGKFKRGEKILVNAKDGQFVFARVWCWPKPSLRYYELCQTKSTLSWGNLGFILRVCCAHRSSVMHLLSKFFCLKLTEIDSRGHLFVLSICTFPQNSIGACSSMTIRDRRYLPTQDVIYFETMYTKPGTI